MGSCVYNAVHSLHGNIIAGFTGFCLSLMVFYTASCCELTQAEGFCCINDTRKHHSNKCRLVGAVFLPWLSYEVITHLYA